MRSFLHTRTRPRSRSRARQTTSANGFDSLPLPFPFQSVDLGVGAAPVVRRLYPNGRTVAGRLAPLRFKLFSNGRTVAGWLFFQQPLSDSRFGCEILRSRRVGFDLASERSHIDSQILVLMDRIRAPDFFHKRTTVQRSIHRGPTWSRRPSAEIGIVKTGSRGNASYPAAPRARRTGRQC